MYSNNSNNSWPPLTPSAVALLNRCSRPLRHRGRRRQPTPATSGLPRCSPPSLEKAGKVWRNYRFGGTSGFFLTGNMKLIAVVFSPSGSNWGDRELLGSNTSSSPRYSRWNHTSIPPFPNLCAGHCFSQLPRVGCQLWCFFLLETAAQPEKCWNRISGMPPKQRIIEAHQNPISISNLCSHGAISLTNPCGLPFPHLLRRPPAQRRQTLQPADGSTKETGVGMVRLYLEDLEKATAFEASEGDLSMFRKESKRWKGDCFLPNVRESAHFFVSLVGACTPPTMPTGLLATQICHCTPWIPLPFISLHTQNGSEQWSQSQDEWMPPKNSHVCWHIQE